MSDFSQFLTAIKSNEIITLFRHVNPDLDALGSQFGLKYWINDNFPSKKVYCLGSGGDAAFEGSDIVEDSMIAQSLAIILDTPTATRVCDSRFGLAKTKFLVDHHPLENSFTEECLQDVRFAATAELLATFMESTDLQMNQRTAKALYMGLLTDTLCFKTNNTTSKTLHIASYLSNCGLNLSELNHEIFDISLNSFKFKALLSERLVVNERFGYVIISHEDLTPFEISLSDAKSYVSEFGEIKSIDIWAVFILNEENLYDGSIRSKNTAINDVAKRYHGGGHRNACGVKSLTTTELNCLVTELKNLSI